MGWHPIGPEGHGVSGDAAMDAMAPALGRVAEAYRARFGRAPLLAEVLHAVRVVLAADPDLLLDPERLEIDFPRPTFPASAPPALDAYEATFSEEPPPDGTYRVSERAGGRAVLSCRLRLDGRTLLVDYTILDESLSDVEVRRLVTWVVLRQYTGNHYRSLVDRVSFASTDGPEARTVVPYG